VYHSVEVPAFRDALSASGLVLGVEPAPRTGPPNGLRDVIPVVPTARRVFTSADRVTAFLRVHQSAAFQPTTVTARLVNVSDLAVWEHRRELDGRSTPSGSVADYLHPIEIHALPTGEYLLTVSIESRGATLQRAARLRVQSAR
jgi:hypothetical protein